MFDFIATPFGYILNFIYGIVKNYGAAIIIFSLIAKACMLPLNIKSKKGMIGQQRIQPQVKELEKYKSDKVKYNEELQKLYKKEGVSATAGCLPTLITLPIMLALYSVIRKPLTIMMHLSADTVKSIIQELAVKITDTAAGFGKNLATWAKAITDGTFKIGNIDEIAISNHVGDLADVNKYEGLLKINYHFLGMDLSATPQLNAFSALWLLPIISGLSSLAVSLVSNRMAKQIQVGDSANPMANNKMMVYMMPLLSVWIGFSLPAGITVYWIVSNIIAIIQEYFMSNYFNKKVLAQRKIDAEKVAEAKHKRLVAAQLKYSTNKKVGKKGQTAPKQIADGGNTDDSEKDE